MIQSLRIRPFHMAKEPFFVCLCLTSTVLFLPFETKRNEKIASIYPNVWNTYQLIICCLMCIRSKTIETWLILGIYLWRRKQFDISFHSQTKSVLRHIFCFSFPYFRPFSRLFIHIMKCFLRNIEQQWFYIPLYITIYKDYGNLFSLNCPFWACTYCNKMNADLLIILAKCVIAYTMIIYITII